MRWVVVGVVVLFVFVNEFVYERVGCSVLTIVFTGGCG